MIEFLNHIQSLDDNTREKKLQLLNDLDEVNPENNTASFTISLSLFKSELNSNYTPKKQISVDYQYIEFAKISIENIDRYKNTGYSYDEYSSAINRDRIALTKFNNTQIAKTREEVWLRTDGATPEEIIQSCEPYILTLLELGKTFHPKNTGELQIGYDINRLTIAYGKLKDWNKVFYWCRLFFDLPKYYRDRSSEGEINSIRRRLDRASKNIEKQHLYY